MKEREKEIGRKGKRERERRGRSGPTNPTSKLLKQLPAVTSATNLHHYWKSQTSHQAWRCVVTSRHFRPLWNGGVGKGGGGGEGGGVELGDGGQEKTPGQTASRTIKATSILSHDPPAPVVAIVGPHPRSMAIIVDIRPRYGERIKQQKALGWRSGQHSAQKAPRAVWTGRRTLTLLPPPPPLLPSNKP